MRVPGLPSAGLARMTPAERDVSFHYKRLGQRAAIVAAGPAANFLFAIVVLALLFMTFGQPFTPAEVGQVQPNSAAERAGIKSGDVIVSINGGRVRSFEDLQQEVRLNPGVPMTIGIKRDGREISVQATPKKSELTDRFGNHYEVGLLGIAHKGIDYVRRDPATAIAAGGGADLGFVRLDIEGDVANRDWYPRYRRTRGPAADCPNVGGRCPRRLRADYLVYVGSFDQLGADQFISCSDT